MQDILIKVDTNEYKIQFDKADSSIVYVNEKPYSVEILNQFGKNLFGFAVNQKLLMAELDFEDEKNMNINYEGFAFKIGVTDDTGKMLSEFIKSAQGEQQNGAGAIYAPMPGMVVKIFAKIGDDVSIGDKLIAVEAMKMENVLKSTINGKVHKINVLENQAVEKNALLIEIE